MSKPDPNPLLPCPSPCQDKCELSTESPRHCLGCGRSLEEIVQWRQFSDSAKWEVLNRLMNEDLDGKEANPDRQSP